MKRDRYDNPLSTTSDAARDHYVAATDLLLAGQPGISDGFQSAIDNDPDFVLAHVGLARGLQYEGKPQAAKDAIAAARKAKGSLTEREASHVAAFDLLVAGNTTEAYPAIRAHVDQYPRDALLAQTCSSVFGLIGFSGKPGREAETLACNAMLLPHYGEDWWCLSQYAFALCETGNLNEADIYIDRSLARNPRNANGAHVRSHIYYETGDIELGVSYLTDWLGPYDRSGYMHGHLSWHAALWALEQGDTQTIWHRLETDILPDVSQSLPINVLTDAASLLFRAELAGVNVPQARWKEVSAYALEFFPKTGIGFIDIHAALAHAMAGDGDALMRIITSPNPSTGDVVTPLAEAFHALAQQKWPEATSLMISAMGDHARLGGSRAQRDLLEFALLAALLKQGKDGEAKHLLALRRPALVGTQAVHGLAMH
ncbi:tetratricopeptide repeat protein [Marivita sp. XM-24bin2]|jgi:tetratricopeptide (TPR) repeat protein|uniref:tetratricopeptide repeat protein n=1 Tax=unclassified Marivita TaxID=2632480 RepID=UPI000D7A9D0E|nr:tetratricopeptide repeat protein [Marivita sp. XM-24bin2]PWL36548.1 MAG: tetratricopeptide repeat protein 38 family protein [Marivita sp. XM-24bin2]